jgi:hypothetical protein
MTGGAPPGARGNGVPVQSWWAPLGRMDPRASDEVLAQLAAAGIAAYAQPDGGTRGGYLEVRPPNRPMDLLCVEGNRRAEALNLIGNRLDGQAAPESDSPENSLVDQDDAFIAIVAGFNDLPATHSWPASEDAPTSTPENPPPATYQRTIYHGAGNPPGLLDPGGLLGDEIRQPGEDPFADDNEHFTPPVLGKAPPIPLLTRLAVLAIVAGVALIVAPAFWGFDDATLAGTLGVAFIVGGVLRLLRGLRDEPDDHDHPEDGAVV